MLDRMKKENRESRYLVLFILIKYFPIKKAIGPNTWYKNSLINMLSKNNSHLQFLIVAAFKINHRTQCFIYVPVLCICTKFDTLR